MTEPYSSINEQNSLLVIIDIQQQLLTAMPQSDAGSLVAKTMILLQAAQAMNIPLVATEQYPKGLGATTPELSSHFPATLQTISKTCFSCADSTKFMSILRSSHRKQIILTGMEAHICVLQTALALQSQGLQVFVVEDAICSRISQNKDNALHRLRQAGVIITNTESTLFEWLRDSKHPQFKTLSKLIT